MTLGGGAAMGYGLAPILGMTGYGGAIFGAGAGLAAAGLQRGGWSGLGMSTAGGAIVGMQLGGPVGGAIGAGIGFVAGLVRMFIKGAQEKIRDKIAGRLRAGACASLDSSRNFGRRKRLPHLAPRSGSFAPCLGLLHTRGG